MRSSWSERIKERRILQESWIFMHVRNKATTRGLRKLAFQDVLLHVTKAGYVLIVDPACEGGHKLTQKPSVLDGTSSKEGLKLERWSQMYKILLRTL